MTEMITFDQYNSQSANIEERLKTYLKQKPVDDERIEALKTILSCIDLTSLEGSDTKVKIFAMCERARTFHEEGDSLPDVAAVCFYPTFVGLAKEVLKDTGIKVATVAAGFPAGQIPLTIKLDEVGYAVAEGADEIDIVISRGKVLANECQEVFDEISELKTMANGALLKVILETGELETVFKIRKASETAILAGADFLKTSTGKIKPAATPEAFLIMLDTIREYFEKTGQRIGIKAAGGIATADDALVYYQLVKQVLGEEWLNKELFRIGASRLANSVADEILGRR